MCSLMCKHVVIACVLFWAVSTLVHALASVSFDMELQFFWKGEPLAAHFTYELLLLVFDLMLVTAISCFEVFGTVNTEKSVGWVLHFDVRINFLGCLTGIVLTDVTLQ